MKARTVITNFLWRVAAWIVSRPAVAAWLIARAQRTPYSEIRSQDGTRCYMERFWLFNPYGKSVEGEQSPARWARLPSIRVHHICLPDHDRDKHDHPWDARTIILSGWYMEHCDHRYPDGRVGEVLRVSFDGDTNTLGMNEYHRINTVSPGGVWTLFFTWGKQGTWGFNVAGKKVPWREYLGEGA